MSDPSPAPAQSHRRKREVLPGLLIWALALGVGLVLCKATASVIGGILAALYIGCAVMYVVYP